MARYTETTIERKEKINEHGVVIVDEIVKFESACTKEYVWFQSIGDYKRMVCAFKTEKRMRKAMEEIGF